MRPRILFVHGKQRGKRRCTYLWGESKFYSTLAILMSLKLISFILMINFSVIFQCVAWFKMGTDLSNSIGYLGTPSVITMATFGTSDRSPLAGVNMTSRMKRIAAGVFVAPSRYGNVSMLFKIDLLSLREKNIWKINTSKHCIPSLCRQFIVYYLIVNDLGLVDYQKECSSPKGESIVLTIYKGIGH